MRRRRRLRKIIFSFPLPFVVFLFGVVFAFIGRDSALVRRDMNSMEESFVMLKFGTCLCVWDCCAFASKVKKYFK
jgi:cytochrome bd-type quinol oxidase subunit 1